MRMLMTVKMPVEAGNELTRDGELNKKIKAIVDEMKPEAVYFTASWGMRSAYIFFDLADASQIPVLAEPWFLAVNAAIEIKPVMTPEDLMKADPGIKAAVEKYG